MKPTSAQVAYLGQLKIQLSDARLASYLQASKGDLLGALARYYWNVELCQAHYPLLNAVEIALRNNLDRAFASRGMPTGFVHINSWLDGHPSRLKHAHGPSDVAHAKEKLPRWDEITHKFRAPVPNHGDLLAALHFGFWTGLLESAYDEAIPQPALSQGAPKCVYVWPYLRDVFPGGRNVSMADIRSRFTAIRHFRNRVFHHEPVWQKRPPTAIVANKTALAVTSNNPTAQNPTPSERYTYIREALQWLGGEQYTIGVRLYPQPSVLDDAAQISLMEQRLLGAIDDLLALAQKRKQEEAVRVAARGAKKPSQEAGGG